jgi:AraC family transcriptional regulator, arabinose operon regulatory protein
MDRRVAHILAVLNQHLATPLTVASLAAEVNLSPSRFAHLFRAEVGTSPARYLHAARLVRARVLLERTFLTVKEVMALVGCNDASHFSRDFRRFHGTSPSALRTVSPDNDANAALLSGDASAAVYRIAALANERLDSPTKPPPRARAPDLACQWQVGIH